MRILEFKMLSIKWSLLICLSIWRSDTLAANIKQPTAVNATKDVLKIGGDHVTIFFDHRVRYHTHEAANSYTKNELAVMVSLISSRFNRILVDTAPRLESLTFDYNSPSRVWIPSVVAQHNKDSNKVPMECIVSFELDPDANYASEAISSFHVARQMADAANAIHPRTVTTLMGTMYATEKLDYAEESQDYSFWRYIQDWPEDGHWELAYVRQLHEQAFPYKLGIFMDIHDCGKFRGGLDSKLKNILDYVDLVSLFIDPTTFHHLTTLKQEETLKMFGSKFEDCERKLKEAKASVRVMGSSLWKSHHPTIASMVESWKGLSAWATSNNKEILMYEAFDTPGGRDFYYWGHGWWRLKDRTTYNINEDSFVEKIDDHNSSIYFKSIYDVDVETFEPEQPVTVSPQQHPPPASTVIEASSNQAVYVVLILYSLVLTVMVIAQIFFYSRITNPDIRRFGNFSKRQENTPSHHSFENPSFTPPPHAYDQMQDSGCSGSDSVLEMADTEPIVPVSGNIM